MVYIEQGRVTPAIKSGSSNASTFGARIGPGTGHPAEPGRYTLLVALQCPFAHRALLMWSLRGLQDAISLAVVKPILNYSVGWAFATREDALRYPECTVPDTESGLGARFIHELYTAADPQYTGTVTVPVLWDKQRKTIVSNDSATIMAMLAGPEFDHLATGSLMPSYYPAELAQQIDELCDWLHKRVNTGVYMPGFATSQGDYIKAVTNFFEALDELEARLQEQRYLIPYYPAGAAAPSPTLADWRLLPTLVRFDAVYRILFKANLRSLKSGYPRLQGPHPDHTAPTTQPAHASKNGQGLSSGGAGALQRHQPLPAPLQGLLEDLLSDPRAWSTVNMRHIVEGYFISMHALGLNPKRRVPLGSNPFRPKASAARRMLGLATDVAQMGSKAPPDANAGEHGEWQRPDSRHRNWIRADGSSEFPAEADRYHLYVANNCPWCHRTSLVRAMLGLQNAVSMDVLFYRRDPDRGWTFQPEEPGCTPDMAAGGLQYIRQLYEAEGSQEKSVPVLYDKRSRRIVSNESADIIRMFETEMKALHRPGAPDLYPPELRHAVDATNTWTYDCLNNGAYKAGFTDSQAEYETAYRAYFGALDRVEATLGKHRFLVGQQVTEADVRLLPTLMRHDLVYYLRFLLDQALIAAEYPNTQAWLMRMWDMPGVQQASDMRHAKLGYFGRTGNNIVPIGPADSPFLADA